MKKIAAFCFGLLIAVSHSTSTMQNWYKEGPATACCIKLPQTWNRKDATILNGIFLLRPLTCCFEKKSSLESTSTLAGHLGLLVGSAGLTLPEVFPMYQRIIILEGIILGGISCYAHYQKWKYAKIMKTSINNILTHWTKTPSQEHKLIKHFQFMESELQRSKPLQDYSYATQSAELLKDWQNGFKKTRLTIQTLKKAISGNTINIDGFDNTKDNALFMAKWLEENLDQESSGLKDLAGILAS